MDKQSVRTLVAGYSIETTVREGARIEKYQDLVPTGTSMYIPHVPGVAREDTVALAARLRKENMDPVPHIVARRTESAAILDDFLKRLVGEAGVTRVLCVAGDIDKPEGEFESALQILERGFIDKHGIKKIGVAGHPQGHKQISEDALKDPVGRQNAYAQKTGGELPEGPKKIPEGPLKEAVARKNASAQKPGAEVRLVTQFSFIAEPVIAWDKAITPINRLPIYIGLPGLAKVSTLLKYALDCGVG